MTRAVMWLLLAVVAAAAAVLSFSALRDLALLCGFTSGLAWLLPVVVDAGAATGCLVWLRSDAGQSGVKFARSLTWLLLASSVAGNALVHGLSAYSLRPAWWVVVLVSAVAPAVLGATVHLAVLVSKPEASQALGAEFLQLQDEEIPQPELVDPAAELIANGAGRRRLARELDVSEHQARKLLASRNGAVR